MQVVYPVIDILIVHQEDSYHWNKGKLFNAAFNEMGKNYNHIILHDVDFIPNKSVDYSPCAVPTLLATECSQFGYGHCYPTFFGGVVGISAEHYKLINGFSNQFKGYGAEDDMLYKSVIAKGLIPDKRYGNRFECFDHPRPKRDEEYQHNLRVLGQGRDFSDGLDSTTYKVIGTDIQTKQITYLYIDTLNDYR